MADSYRIAVVSNNGVSIDEHYGRARKFYIYDVIEDENYTEVGIRELIPACVEGSHDDKTLESRAKTLNDCRYVIAARIGPGALRSLEAEGIEGYEFTGDIDEAIDKLVRYKQAQELFE